MQKNEGYYDNVSGISPHVVGEHNRSKIKTPSTPSSWTKETIKTKENYRSYILKSQLKKYGRDCFHVQKSS